MKYALTIILLIFLGIGYYFCKKNSKNKTNNLKKKNEINLYNKEKQTNNKLIKIEKLPIDSIKHYELLSEIKDNKLLAHVNNLLPGLAQVATSANNAIQTNSNVLYQAIIPAGTTLTNSATMNNAVRGLYHGLNGIQGHANFIAVNRTNQAVANTVSTGVGITSMIVGQYYMTQINAELTKINDEISKISSFQNSEYKSRIIALLIQIKRISISTI